MTLKTCQGHQYMHPLSISILSIIIRHFLLVDLSIYVVTDVSFFDFLPCLVIRTYLSDDTQIEEKIISQNKK